MRSPAFNAVCAPARIAVCVHCGPPLAFAGGAGAGTCVQFGVLLVLAAVSVGAVSGPTIPSTRSFAAAWNQRTAAVVFAPSLPSTVPALQPSALSWRWMRWTVAASLVPGFAFGSVLACKHVRA